MKGKNLIIVVYVLCVACNDNGEINEKKLDAEGVKLQKTVQKGADTLGSKLKKLKNKIDDRLNR